MVILGSFIGMIVGVILSIIWCELDWRKFKRNNGAN